VIVIVIHTGTCNLASSKSCSDIGFGEAVTIRGFVFRSLEEPNRACSYCTNANPAARKSNTLDYMFCKSLMGKTDVRHASAVDLKLSCRRYSCCGQ